MNEYGYRRLMEKFSLTEGENLKYLQKEKGMTNEKLGEKIYLDSKTIYRYRSGKNKISPERAQEIADALDIPLEELTSESKRLKRGIKEKREKIFKRPKEIAKTLKKSVAELSSQDIQSEEVMKKGLEDEKDSLKSKAEKKYDDIFINQVLKDTNLNKVDLKESELIYKYKDEFLEIYSYDWTFIQRILELDDSDIDWIKEFMFEYLLYSELFERNLKEFGSFLSANADVLNMVITYIDENKSIDISIEKKSDDSDILSQKLNNFAKCIEFKLIITEEFCEMMKLFFIIHDCVTLQTPHNN